MVVNTCIITIRPTIPKINLTILNFMTGKCHVTEDCSFLFSSRAPLFRIKGLGRRATSLVREVSA